MIMRPDGGSAPPPAAAPVAGALNLNQQVAAAEHNIASGNGTIGDQSTIMNGSAGNLVAAAGSGFKLDPEAATALIASCDESLDILRGAQWHLNQVAQAPKLGGTAGAVKISAFTQSVAADHQGIVDGVRNLQATILQMRQAYQKAASNYHAIEHQIADSVASLDHEVQQRDMPTPQHGRNRAV